MASILWSMLTVLSVAGDFMRSTPYYGNDFGVYHNKDTLSNLLFTAKGFWVIDFGFALLVDISS
jgi:hypothetical protein